MTFELVRFVIRNDGSSAEVIRRKHVLQNLVLNSILAYSRGIKIF